MGEPTTEASDRFGSATCKVVVSEPCRETRGWPAQNLGSSAAALKTVAPDINTLKVSITGLFGMG